MKKIRKPFILLVTMIILLSLSIPVYANWGWVPTKQMDPYEYQSKGKWYDYDETKVFMVQMDDKTYQYIFDNDGNLLSSWVTDVPMHLP
ncbi:Hypothetical protein LUCI_4277 [Lucifera butyrica]|uniref:Uncharacterized protein n=1 Tax=Lucifera butyrica TaxID=1351585 RepID=A0A498RC76_9FIRM|nr:hypothetical protein [Lucifera butyrica]VBB08991.1 Hypothetical protein LUCI_4277 [Lucifera butyrica]